MAIFVDAVAITKAGTGNFMTQAKTGTTNMTIAESLVISSTGIEMTGI